MLDRFPPSSSTMTSAPPASITPEQYQQSADETAEELICAITFELPVDPVTAEDGRVYERRAIEEWLARPGELKSPTLNTPMGRRLLPARQVRNAIERMVRSGILSGPRAESWEKKIAGEKEVAVMRKRAEDGDADAMYILGTWCYSGERGLALDRKQAFGWFEQGHALDHAPCTCGLAERYLSENEAFAMHLTTLAAARGDEYACYCLGKSYARGHHGLCKDAEMATHWFAAMQSATWRDAGEADRDHAAKWLREHAARPPRSRGRVAAAGDRALPLAPRAARRRAARLLVAADWVGAAPRAALRRAAHLVPDLAPVEAALRAAAREARRLLSRVVPEQLTRRVIAANLILIVLNRTAPGFYYVFPRIFLVGECFVMVFGLTRFIFTVLCIFLNLEFALQVLVSAWDMTWNYM